MYVSTHEQRIHYKKSLSVKNNRNLCRIIKGENGVYNFPAENLLTIISILLLMITGHVSYIWTHCKKNIVMKCLMQKIYPIQTRMPFGQRPTSRLPVESQTLGLVYDLDFINSLDVDVVKIKFLYQMLQNLARTCTHTHAHTPTTCTLQKKTLHVPTRITREVSHLIL